MPLTTIRFRMATLSGAPSFAHREGQPSRLSRTALYLLWDAATRTACKSSSALRILLNITQCESCMKSTS